MRNDKPTLRGFRARQLRPVPLKSQFVAAVDDLEALHATSKVEVDPDHKGNVRGLFAGGNGLFNQIFTGGDVLAHARKFINLPETRRSLGLRYAELDDGEAEKFDFGTRVIFKQVARVKGCKEPLKVRRGAIIMLIDNSGNITLVESTIRQGSKPVRLGKIISADDAVARAQRVHGSATSETRECELVLSSHEDSKDKSKLRLDPVYEIVLFSGEPEVKQFGYLVDARTGAVVHQYNKLHFSQTSQAQKAVNDPQCRYFPRTPDPKKGLESQLIDYSITDLPDPSKLENANLRMHVLKSGGKWQVTKAKEDGSFNYGIKDVELTSVIDFVAINKLWQLQLQWGMKNLAQPLPVYTDDPSVVDNAYADPINLNAHMGVGSGPPGGLRKRIGLDKMVPRHEVNGHIFITIMTPGHDLPGNEGAATHEGNSDAWAFLGEYWELIEFAERLGIKFDIEYIRKDQRVVGPYSMDGGIRKQRNKKQAGKDETGEPHDDGEIIGAAVCDLLQALCEKYNPDLKKGLEVWGRMNIAAMAVVPVHKVTFKDILRAHIAADQTLNGGVHRTLIEQAFAGHGIKLSNKGETPVITIPQPRRRRRRKSA